MGQWRLPLREWTGCRAGVVVFQARPGRAGLLDEPFWQTCLHLRQRGTHIHSSNRRGGRDARKEHAFREFDANLHRRRYTPIPSKTPAIGSSSMSLESTQLSLGGTELLDL